MKKSQIFTILGGSALLGALMYRRQKKQQAPVFESAPKQNLATAVKKTTVSAKNLATELQSSMGTIDEITTEINDFMVEIDPKVQKLTKSLAKFQK
ncbi:hypothetical protein LPAF129_06520 [Ligilactobacillus pabuli]|uniref:YtxH domain-containing protein n=1 Tax=Ligilactobacillus pabuli TaxID=2886039 RepID=A0ABQ5JG16_9LACO|nr:hypothetical protein [Ligilactobacillus pabuli]GKS80967.1 hypothetical protein LPAF129_06520 [Ligilactobacillus pabuli]